MGIAAHAALISARRSPKGKSPEVLNLVNIVWILMYLFVLSSIFADSHPGKPARLDGSVGMPRLVGRRPQFS